MKNVQRFLMVTGLVAAAIGGFAVGRLTDDAGKTAEESQKPADRRTIASAGDDAALAALRRRVSELEAKLAAAKSAEALPAAAVAEAKDAAKPEVRDERKRFNPRERMEELKKSDPAKYAQITNRMARMHQNRQERERAKAGYLASIDTSHMSASAKKTHDELQQLMERKAELEAKMDEQRESGAEPDDASMRETFEEMREIDRQMRKLNGEERDNLLAETAAAVGLEGDDAQEMVDTIKDIYESTESGRHGPHMAPPEGGGAGEGPQGGPMM